MPRDTTSIRITREAHEKLQDMADADGMSLTDELDRIIEEQRRQRLFDEANRAYARLQENEAARAEVQQESEELDGPYEGAFDALEDPGRAGNLKVRAKLMDLLADYIQERGFNQQEAAEHFGVSQSRISQLLNGHISKFTIDYLINMCSRAGIEINITFDRARVA